MLQGAAEEVQRLKSQARAQKDSFAVGKWEFEPDSVFLAQMRFHEKVKRLIEVFHKLCDNGLHAVEFLYFAKQLLAAGEFMEAHTHSGFSRPPNVYAAVIANAKVENLIYDEEATLQREAAICHQLLAICRMPFIITGVSRVSDLYRLQQIDTEIELRGSQLAAINDQIANSPAMLQAQAEHKATQDSLAAARKQAKMLDDENKNLTTKIKVEEERLYGGKVKNLRELKDLQAEIDALKHKRETLDEEQLTAMDAVEGAETIESAARANLAKVEAARAEEVRDLIRDRDHLLSLISNLQENRSSAITNISADDLALYESLRKRKRGVAVAALANSSCKGCGESQSSSRIQIAKQEVEIARCASCERILYGGQEAGYTTVEGGDDEMVTRW